MSRERPPSAAARRRVVVLGASPNEERYSNHAVRSLLEHGFEVVPVHPTADEVRGVPCVRDLGAVSGPIDTVTLYVSPEVSSALVDAVLALRPARIVMNPGAENPTLAQRAKEAGIAVVHGCTLVMLAAGRF